MTNDFIPPDDCACTDWDTCDPCIKAGIFDGWKPSQPKHPIVILQMDQLPDDHPAWLDQTGAYSGVSRRWWKVTVIDDAGAVFEGTAADDRRHDGWLQTVIREVTRPERPSETVMRLLEERKAG